MDQDEKVRENRLRRQAERYGMQLRKSRRRDPRAYDYGTYQLVDPYRNMLIFGDSEVCNGFGLSLDEVEEILSDDECVKRGQHADPSADETAKSPQFRPSLRVIK